MTAITVDIWADFACPWCFIGKRRFEKAASQFKSAPVEVKYHSFELAPDTPPEFTGTQKEFMAETRGMQGPDVETMFDRVSALATAEGLEIDFDAVPQANTNLAHQLAHFANSQGKQTELVEALFSAHFEQERRLSSLDELVAVAGEAGLDEAGARAALETGVYAGSVAEDIEQAQAYGINSVPFFVFNNKYGVAGAQESAALLEVLEQVHAESLD